MRRAPTDWINGELRMMQHLASPEQNRSINCTTCHRGMANANRF